MPRGQIPLYREIRERDAAFYERLAKSGFQLDFGADEFGLMMKALRSGSGYYIDVGASESDRQRRHRRQERRRDPAASTSAPSSSPTASELPADLIVWRPGSNR